MTPLAQGPQSTPDQVEAPLPSLSPGSYVVSWRLLSVDGHPVGGSVFFTLGTAQHHADPGGMVRAAETPAGLRIAHLVARGLTYAGALLAAGLALFLVLFGRHAAVDYRAIARPADRGCAARCRCDRNRRGRPISDVGGRARGRAESDDARQSSRNGFRSGRPGAVGRSRRPSGRAGPAQLRPNAGRCGRARGRGVVRVHRPHGPPRFTGALGVARLPPSCSCLLDGVVHSPAPGNSGNRCRGHQGAHARVLRSGRGARPGARRCRCGDRVVPDRWIARPRDDTIRPGIVGQNHAGRWQCLRSRL